MIDIEASGEINASRTHSDCLDHTHTFFNNMDFLRSVCSYSSTT